MGIIYSIPVKPIKNNGALKCTIPKEITDKIGIKKDNKIVWILYDDGKIEVKIEK
jgi:bifunctional DNA-binding transcriptional regulator/antitoxin component of YhaV-PrlF toxin-antitoxin module